MNQFLPIDIKELDNYSFDQIDKIIKKLKLGFRWLSKQSELSNDIIKYILSFIKPRKNDKIFKLVLEECNISIRNCKEYFFNPICIKFKQIILSQNSNIGYDKIVHYIMTDNSDIIKMVKTFSNNISGYFLEKYNMKISLPFKYYRKKKEILYIKLSDKKKIFDNHCFGFHELYDITIVFNKICEISKRNYIFCYPLTFTRHY